MRYIDYSTESMLIVIGENTSQMLRVPTSLVMPLKSFLDYTALAITPPS